ncbi:hydrogenase expression protein [Halobacteriales archaeon QS_8_69_26]|nr:MAG: hydrogenase expression protein [Halobacteriales archaeon QS_8_69_26]
MSDGGKVDRAFFERYLRPRLGADRDDVALGPAYGVDFGVVEVGGRAVVTATDPLSILPDLGWERAGRFALQVVLADVAVSGLVPTHLSVAFHLPPDLSDEAFSAVWEGIHAEAEDLGAAIVTGHTGRYEGCSLPWVGGATAMAVGDPDDVVRPDGARPGDRLLVTKGPAVETAALLATLFGDRIDLPAGDLRAARDRVDDLSPVRDALVAAAAGPVTAMHDATERGIANALVEMADAAGVRIEAGRSSAPLLDGVGPVCAHFGIDPWVAGSAGTLLVTVRPEGVEAVLGALESEGIPAAEVGRVRDGEGATLDGDPVNVPDTDPFAAVYADLLDGGS